MFVKGQDSTGIYGMVEGSIVGLLDCWMSGLMGSLQMLIRHSHDGGQVAQNRSKFTTDATLS
jgi:hypothetical protein